jgi:hypothetical protein
MIIDTGNTALRQHAFLPGPTRRRRYLFDLDVRLYLRNALGNRSDHHRES